MNQRNRGKKSNDDKDFAIKWHAIFTSAADDLCFLLSRGYAIDSSLQLVGNRYRLNKRQRLAIKRIGASQQAITERKNKEYSNKDIQNAHVEIDGFNLLILLESALSGAYLFEGRDGTIRDMSSVHGSYKRVNQTPESILLIGKSLEKLQVQSVKWLLDQPISNSGRLKTLLQKISDENNYSWKIELVYSPDKLLANSTNVIVSSDAWILDQTQSWFNLGRYIITNYLDYSNMIKI